MQASATETGMEVFTKGKIEIHAVTFDLDDTLYDNLPVIKSAVAAMFAELDRAHPPPAEAFAPAPAAVVVASAKKQQQSQQQQQLAPPVGEDGEVDEPLWHAIGEVLRPALTLARVEAGDVQSALAMTTRRRARHSDDR